MASIFSKIIADEVPAYKIAENHDFLAILDAFPIARGHALVIPKKEIDYIFDIGAEEYQRYWLFAKEVAVKIEAAIECERVGIAVVGLEVPHAHIHLIPINSVADINFSKPKLKFSETEMNEIASAIRSA